MKSTAFFKIVNMIIRCGFSFFSYMRRTGLFGRPWLIILSSQEGANYGRTDLSQARTLINLRRLNLIKHLEMFVSSLARLLPPETTFVGCFACQGNSDHDARYSGNMPLFISKLNHRRPAHHVELNPDKVSAILSRCGLVVIDMMELNGLTYFHSRKRIN